MMMMRWRMVVGVVVVQVVRVDLGWEVAVGREGEQMGKAGG